jgi:predicted RNA binding protein YcfA (HicA-like mRNA interferase family)
VGLSVVSGRKVVKALTKAGFEVAGRRGSHIKLKKKVDGKVFVVIVPDHGELAKGTLKAILRQANITREDFLKLIKSKA